MPKGKSKFIRVAIMVFLVFASFVGDFFFLRWFVESQLGSQQFVGSVIDKIYHYPFCQYVRSIRLEDRIVFSSAGEAKNRGFQSCIFCKPP